MSVVITISNQKGGVGKTTTCAALASGLFLAGHRVLGIDLDPQGNLGFCLGGEEEHPWTVLDLLNGSVSAGEAVCQGQFCDLLLSDITLSGWAARSGGSEAVLREAIRPLEDSYDYIVIDTPPALNLLTVNAYTASDYLVIPMASDILSLVGLSQLKETIESVRSSFNPSLKVLGILLNRFNHRTLLSRDVLEMAEQLAAQIGTQVFDTKIRTGVAIAEAPAHGESIFSYNPRSSAVKDYKNFLEEVLRAIPPHSQALTADSQAAAAGSQTLAAAPDKNRVSSAMRKEAKSYGQKDE